MNKRVLGTLVCATASLAVGCIYDPHGAHGGDDSAALPQITASWQFRDMADGAQTGCPAGFDTAAVFSQPIDDAGGAVGDAYLDLFACSDGIGATGELPPDRYLAWVEIQRDDASETYAQSLSQVADVTAQNARVSTTILNDGGYLALSWSLVGAQSDARLGCADVPGLTSIAMHSASPTAAYDDAFPCEDASAVTAGLVHGTYTVSIDARRGDRSAGEAPALSSKIISGPNRVTDLGHIVIPIDGQ